MLCTLVRWRVSEAIDARRPYGARLDRHLARCERCRAFAARWAALDTRLAASAVAAPRPAAAGRRAPRLLVFGGAGVAVAAAAVLAIGLPASRTPSHETVATTPVMPTLAAASAAKRSVERLLSADPLGDELGALRRDAKRVFAIVAPLQP